MGVIDFMSNANVRTPFIVSSSPHLRAEEGTADIMRWVCVALAPAFGAGVYAFGPRVVMVALAAVAACVLTEALCQKWRGARVSVGDFSAVLSGLLLAATLPPNVPWWVPVLGGVFAMGVVKHAFGGLGSNVWNPALAARAFLQVSFPTYLNAAAWPRISDRVQGVWARCRVWMDGSFGDYDRATAAYQEQLRRGMEVAQREYANVGAFLKEMAPEANFPVPFEALRRGVAATPPDVVSGATAMTRLKGLAAAADDAPRSAQELLGASGVDYWQLLKDAFSGVEGGCIAETSAIALLLGGLFLIWRRIIGWEAPFCYLATVALLGWALPAPYAAGGAAAWTPWFSGPVLLHLGGGGLMLAAFFMETDYVTTPLTRRGKVVFALGCGLITAMIRLYSSSYPEGCCYSILIMNTCVPLIDAWTRPRKYGA